MQRPQTATTVTSNQKSNESFSVSRQLELQITLKLSANPRLTSLFPSDPHADLIVNFQGKQYKLQKAHLRLETNYFDSKPTEFEETQYFNQGVFEKVLHCLYGKEYLITKNSELYYAFQVCHALAIQSLVKQLEQAILEDFESFNFCIVYQLGETFKNDELRQACFEHLQNNPNIFKKTLDLSKAKCIAITLIKTKQLFQQPNYIETSTPSSVLLLNEVCFKQLIKLHNSYKQLELNNYVYISYEEIYELICAYVECRAPRAQDIELYRDMVRSFVIELIDKQNLKSKEYKYIYHSDLLLIRPEDVYLGISSVHQEPSIQQMNNTVVKNTRNLSKDEQPKQKQEVQTIQQINFDQTTRRIQMLQAFDPVLSENFLTKIEVRELREENTNLLQEVQKLKIHLESSVEHGNTFNQQIGQMKSHFNKLDQRLDQKMSLLQQDLIDLKAQLQAKSREVQQKDKTIMKLQEQIQQMLPNQTQSIVIPVQQNESYIQEDEDLNDREEESFRVEQIEESQSRLFDQFTVNESQIQNSQIQESQLQLEVTQLDMEQSCITVQTTQSEYFNQELVEKPKKYVQQQDLDSEINVISQSYLKTHTHNRSNVSVSLQVNQSNKFIFRNDSVTLENHSDICFLQKFFDISIFQKIECQQVYIGSRDGYSCAEFMRICSGLTGLLILMKSFDYDKNFGIYLNTELEENELNGQGFVFSVTHQFVIPIDSVKFGGKNFIKVGQGDLIIGNDCCEESTCFCSYPKSLEVVKGMNYSHLTGAKVFQLEEIEAFQLTITQTMS